MIKSILKSIYALLEGHFTVFKHSFMKKVTLEYPEIRPVLNERFRGKHVWFSDKCLGCKICEKVCPAGAINIFRNSDGNLNFSLDLKKCIFCGNCVYNCKKGALVMSDNFELATDKKSDLTIEINTFNFSNNSNIINNKCED